MRSIKGVSVVLGMVLTAAAVAADKRDQQAELEALKIELKPLRERAYQEPEVLASRKALDAAYRAYWDSVRAAMLQLDPEKKQAIEREITLRKQLSAVRPAAEPKKKPQKPPEKKAKKSPG